MKTPFIKQMNDSVYPVVGYAESASIAQNSAMARRYAQGNLIRVVVKISAYLYKNAMCMGIPGSTECEIDLFIALGIILSHANEGLYPLDEVDEFVIGEAKKILPMIEVECLDLISDIYIETILTTDLESVRVITAKEYDKIVDISHRPFGFYTSFHYVWSNNMIYDLEEYLSFVNEVTMDELSSMKEAASANAEVYQAGLLEDLDELYAPMISTDPEECTPYEYARKMAGVACYTRMSHTTLKMMEVRGSGNHSFTIFLSIEAIARYFHIDAKKKFRSLALAILVDQAVKSQLDVKSSFCSPSVAAGIGAAIGIVFMLGGKKEEMLIAMKNMITSIYGMKCDGSKEGCVGKVGMIAGLSVEAAMAAYNHISIDAMDGKLDGDFLTTLRRLPKLLKEQMHSKGSFVKIEKERFYID